MAIDMTYGDLSPVLSSLTVLGQKPLGVKFALKVAGIRRTLKGSMEDFQAVRDAKVAELGGTVKNLPDGTVTFDFDGDQDKLQAFVDAMSELNKEAITVGVKPVTVAEIETLETVEANVIEGLGPLIELE